MITEHQPGFTQLDAASQTTQRRILQEVIAHYPSPGIRLWLSLKEQLGQMPPARFVSLLNGWRPSQILELGCGYGMLSHYLASMYPEASVFGIDLNPKRIAVAQASQDHSQKSNLTFAHQDALTLAEAEYDFIILVDVLHHVGKQNQQPLLEKLFRLLKPGGRLMIREINAEHPIRTLNAHLFDTLFYWEISHFLPRNTLCKKLTQSGFEALDVHLEEPPSWAFPYITYLGHKPA